MIDNPHTLSLTDVDRSALVLLSGGQDSTTCLYWALSVYNHVETVSFDYGQRHKVELAAAAEIAEEAGVRHELLQVPALSQIGAASLTNSTIRTSMEADGTGNVYAAEHGLPSSFVPGRNAILISTAMAFAAPHGMYDIVIGVCEADEAGYPDCRAPFVEAMETALRVALDDERVTLVAPLLHLDKARTFALAAGIDGALEAVLDRSHTCYEGDHTTWNVWGWGCGECPACKTRAKGWVDFRKAQEATA